METLDGEAVGLAGRRLTMRRYKPFDPTCPLHLRRVCGVCADFPPGADMRAKAQICGRLKKFVNGTRCAANCKDWARKSAPVDQLKPKEIKMGLNSKREFRTVIVYGEGPCGKTHHGADIARALGCNDVVDGWGFYGFNEITPGALHLAAYRPKPGSVPADVLIMSIDAAMAAAFVVGAI